MARVITRKYSNFFDVKTEVQFQPVLDVSTNTYVGVAEVNPEMAEKYRGRPGFEVIDSASFLALTSREEDPEPAEPITGDPLSDAAAALEDAASAVDKAEAATAKARGAKAAPPPPPPSA